MQIICVLHTQGCNVGCRYLDFLDILLLSKDGSGVGLTDSEIRDEVNTFLLGGHDTIAAGLSTVSDAVPMVYSLRCFLTARPDIHFLLLG